MIHCKELNTEFETKEELFKALKENKSKIIDIKKKSIHTGYDPLNPENSKQIIANSQVKLKALNDSASKELFNDDNYYYFAVNTTKILDSHNDLHANGIWNKSAKEQSGKNYLVDTHILTMKTILAYPEDIEIFVAVLPFKALGHSYKGEAEVLVYKVLKDKVVKGRVRDAIEDGKTMQASVKMQYVKMDLAMNSEDEDDKEEFKNYNDTINDIANLKDFETPPLYYFIQKEAKNIHESSLVPFGSNHVTGQIKNIEPSKDTQKQRPEAVIDTSLTNFLTHLTNK